MQTTTFEDVAHQIVAHGTWSSRSALEAMAALASSLAPGAAAALIDWTGSEVARLRAFSIVASRLAPNLSSWDIAQLVVGAVGPQAA